MSDDTKDARAMEVAKDFAEGRVTMTFDRITEPFDPEPERPMCAKCKRKVDTIYYTEDPTRGARGVMRVVIGCHNETSITELDLDELDLLEASGGKWSATGVAFGDEHPGLTIVAPPKFTGGEASAIAVSDRTKLPDWEFDDDIVGDLQSASRRLMGPGR